MNPPVHLLNREAGDITVRATLLGAWHGTCILPKRFVLTLDFGQPNSRLLRIGGATSPLFCKEVLKMLRHKLARKRLGVLIMTG